MSWSFMWNKANAHHTEYLRCSIKVVVIINGNFYLKALKVEKLLGGLFKSHDLELVNAQILNRIWQFSTSKKKKRLIFPIPSVPFIAKTGIQIKLWGNQTGKKKWHCMDKRPFNFCAAYFSFHGMDTSGMVTRYWVLEVQDRCIFMILDLLSFCLHTWS